MVLTGQKLNKKCSICKNILPLDRFYRRENNRLKSSCISCYKSTYKKVRTDKPEHTSGVNKKAKLLYKYKMSVSVFEELLSAQGNKCSICKQYFKNDTDTCIDHNHSCCNSKLTCGKCTRGILCRRCNVALGGFRDDTTILKNAIKYLEYYK